MKVRLVMSEKEIKYKEIMLDPDSGDLSSPEYLSLNPSGVVPTLVHDNLVLSESSVIMNYIEDYCSSESLRPITAEGKARMNMWMKLADEVYFPALGALIYATLLRPKYLALSEDVRNAIYEKNTDLNRRQMKRDLIENGLESVLIPDSIRTIVSMLDRIEGTLDKSMYLSGDSYSLADAAITPFIYRLSLMNLLEQPEISRPGLISWWERMKSRTSYDEVISSRINPDIETMIMAVSEVALPKLQKLILAVK